MWLLISIFIYNNIKIYSMVVFLNYLYSFGFKD